MAFKLKTQVPTEKQEHLSFLAWAKFVPVVRDVVCHVANEYDGGIIGGRQRKLMGVRKGYPDFSIPLARKPYHGLYIELKRRHGSKVSVEQQWWVDKLNELGYLAKVCYGCDEAINLVTRYLKLEGW